MIKDVRREEMSKFSALSGCTYNDEICFLKLKSLSDVTRRLSTMSDGVMLWLRMGVGQKRISLLRCLDAPIIMKSVLFALNLNLLFVIQPEISRQSPSCLRERSVSAVDKDMYTWISSGNKWWPNLSLWIRELSGVVYRVNSCGPRTEPWGTQQNKGTVYENKVSYFY